VTLISYVVDDLRVGGAQTHLTRLVQELSRRGHALEVICMGDAQPVVTSQIPPGVPVVSFRLASVRDPGFLPQLLSLVRHLRRGRPSVVHTYLNTAGVFGLIAARLAGVPHVVTSRRDIGIFRSGRIRALEAFLSRRWADRVFCVCEAVARAVRRDERIPEEKLRVLLNGIDVSGVVAGPTAREGPVRFGIVAAINRVEKGHRELVEAAAIVARTFASVELHLVGDGPLRPALEARAKELGLSEKAFFHGERRDVLAFLDTIDVLVVPSYTEGISNAALEAMAKGLPVIASGVDGNLETVTDGETGLLVAPRDPEALARGMERYARDRDLRVRHGRAGRERLDRLFTLGRMADRYEEEYREILGRGSQRPRIALVESSSGVGGTAKYVRQLVETLDPARFESVVLARADVGWYRGVETRGARAVFSGGRPGTSRPSGDRLRTYLGRARDLLRMVPRFFYFRRQFRRLGVDLVHTNNNVFEHVPALAAGRSLGLPVICHLHDQVPLTQVERIAVRWPQRFFVLSGAAREMYGRDIPASKLHVVHNGLILSEYDRDRLPTSPRALEHPAVGLVGRLVSWKGHETLIRAIPGILAEVPAARFYFIGDDPSGDGSTRERLERLAADLGCGAALEMLGWVDDPRPLLAQLQVSLVPSTSPEPFGLVILESMALGVPVVASRHGGPLDIINDDADGLFHDPGDAAGLARQVVRLLTDPGLASRISAAGRLTVTRRFSMDAVAAAVQEHYSELLGSGSSGGGQP
jgi:glycosyltransferase involved in cell wall biosynthesis